jgi:putative heme-binding domain-containing protein
MKFVLTLLLALPLLATAAPQWIWSSKHAAPNEKATFRKSFTVAGEVKTAKILLVCDNGATAFLNGKQVVENPDWMETSRADVKTSLKAGENELRINGRNHGGGAALLAVLEIEMADGKKTVVETGEGWEFAPDKSDSFKPATVVAKHGEGPWGEVLTRTGKGNGKTVGSAPGTATPVDDIVAPPGFKVELLYTVPKADQGSWVSMTVDPKGRLICGDQYGGLYRVTPSPVGKEGKTNIEQIPSDIGGAHGLLYANNALYVMNNEKANANCKPGLWRMKDTGDGQFATAEYLRAMQGGGEHGPHSMQLTPDGKGIYFNGGNHTKLPDNLEISRGLKDGWGEDHILPRMWDANGHARGIWAPGGYICKTDFDAKKVELFASGFRNEFDFALDANGEIVTYDADMEWDMGSPWYRPTRINHVVSGGEYGWRSGSGKWPSYYEDSLPAGVDIGPGSPTGTTFGTGAKFPAKYQRAFFGNDWTYGTMYAIHMTPDGAGMKMEKEEFVFGKPLPLTDVVINPVDGAMYFAVGGRKTQSALYRVTYVGKESTAPAKPYEVTKEAKQRHVLEKLHEEGTGPEAIDKAWPFLSSKDRFLRFAARVAIERQPAKLWEERALKEKDTQASIEALIALARVSRTTQPEAATGAKPGPGKSSDPVAPVTPESAKVQAKILAALGNIEAAKLDVDHQLQLIRAYQLAFTRLGKPDAATLAAVAAKFDGLYPSKDTYVNRELCQLLVFLDSKSVVAKTLGMVATAKDDSDALASDELLARNSGYAKAAEEVHKSRPNKQQLALMWSLRNATAGWTSDLKKTYFGWFPHARTWKGGNSFKGFWENARNEALDHFAGEDRVALNELSSKSEIVPANYVAPKGPGKNWTIDEVVALTKGGLKGRNYENGKAMFTSVSCVACHHFMGDGGNIGPDISGAGSRYSIRDLMENIIEPSKVISDQYESHQIEKTDGSMVIGRIVSEDADNVQVMMNPFSPTTLSPIKKSEIKSKKTYPISMMPPGMINVLNQDELLDLIAYLLSAGNPNDKAFAK